MPRKKKNTTIRKNARRVKNEAQQAHEEKIFDVASTEFDESDDLEQAKKTVSEELQEELEPIETGSVKEKVLKGPKSKPPTKTVKKRKQDSATDQEKLGWLGEWLCQEHLSIELGYNPKDDHHPTRNNKFDSEKDGRDPNGRAVEIKTQNRHPRGYFTIPHNQLKKCTEVERLIFVEYDNSNLLQLWECVDRTYETIKLKDGGSRIGFPIRQMNLLLKSANEELAQEFRKFSSSAFIKKS